MSEMKEYIERGALKEKAEIIRKKMLTEKHEPLTVDIMNDFADLLDQYAKDIPAADVEPVVRCKDCVKWGKRDCKRNPCAIDISSMDEFCSDGERKAHMERSGSGE